MILFGIIVGLPVDAIVTMILLSLIKAMLGFIDDY
jgi:hypothetical protein